MQVRACDGKVKFFKKSLKKDLTNKKYHVIIVLSRRKKSGLTHEKVVLV